jgi:D-glycero-D-manno-heptose 1,7-bisphosphate phosphatase
MKTIIDISKKTIVQIPDQLKPALCLDLDGTVRYSRSGKFINKPEDIVLFERAEEKIWEYRKAGHLIFGITNQGGVAYNLKTPADYEAEIEAMLNLFKANPFHIIKCCFHHENGNAEPYNHRSLLRKPGVGMLVLCEIDAWEKGFIVDWDNSLFVGDRPEDEQCALNANINFQWSNEFFEREKSNGK